MCSETGTRGSGRSTFAHALTSYCNERYFGSVAVEWVSCRSELLGQSFNVAAAALSKKFRKARRRGPCLLVLDDLDCVLPNTSKDDADNGGGGGGSAGDSGADALVEVSLLVNCCLKI